MSYTLRPWRAEDAAGYRAAVDESIDELKLWVNWAHLEPLSLQETAARLAEYAEDFQNGVRWRFAIIEDATQRILGGATLHKRIGEGGRDLGYWLRQSSTGWGIMTATVCALLKIAFTEQHAEVVEIHADVGNERSAAIPLRLGFKLAGTQPRTRPTGEERITRVYRMMRSEYPTPQIRCVTEPIVLVSV